MINSATDGFTAYFLTDPWPDQEEMETLTASTVRLSESFYYPIAKVRVDFGVEQKEYREAWSTSPLEILPRS